MILLITKPIIKSFRAESINIKLFSSLKFYPKAHYYKILYVY